MTDKSPLTPAASTSSHSHEKIIELSMRRDLAKRMGGIWIQKAAAEYVHARTARDNGDLKTATDPQKRGIQFQQRATECWAAVGKFNRILRDLQVPSLTRMNAGTHPDYVRSTEKGLKVGEQVVSAMHDMERGFVRSKACEHVSC